MKERLRILVKSYILWILFFVLQKPIFMLLQHERIGSFSLKDVLLVIWHGLPLDWSVASYIAMLIGLLLVISVFVKGHIVQCIADGLTALLLAVGIGMLLADNGTFPAWGHHPDRTLLLYLSTPKEALACAEWWVWLIGALLFVTLFAACWLIYRQMIHFNQLTKVEGTWKTIRTSALLLLLIALCFLPARGSVSVSTMNTGRAYFSNRQMLNVAAVNPLFYLIESPSVNSFDASSFHYTTSQEAKTIVDSMFCACGKGLQEPPILLRTRHPHVVMVILESFSSNAWEAMPRLRELASEGLFFSNAYAAGFRTDRGVMALLSGMPSLPKASLMTVPSKSQHLPHLGATLARENYCLHFYYGGDEDFTSMRSYLVDGGFVQRVSDKSFAVKDRLSKWGVPDHLLCQRAAEDIANRHTAAGDKRYFDVLLTLSSHEPFDVPATKRFNDAYLNAVAYTDSCVGALADHLKANGDWENTLLVLSADHGYPYPYHLTEYEPQKNRIPIVMAGGAVAQPREIKSLTSQVDIIPTLLGQMGIESGEYVFGKDALAQADSCAWAFYTTTDQFALVTATDTMVIDLHIDKPIIGCSTSTEKKARAYMQCLMEFVEEL